MRPPTHGGLGPWDRTTRARALDLIPWLPTIIGVATLLALMVVAAVQLRPWRPAPPPLPVPAAPLGPLSPLARSSSAAPLTSPVSNTTAPTATGTPGSRPTSAGTVTSIAGGPVAPHRHPTTGPTAGPPSPVTGQYSVLNSYPQSFIGQVLVTNSSGSDRGWSVTLVFPDNVGTLRTSWLESLPQPTLSHSGQTYTWRSSMPLAAGSSGALRFDFNRSGSGDRPSQCVTDGSPCTG